MSALGEYIKKKRAEKNITQKDLATHLGFSGVFMGRVEAGECPLPIKYVHKLAKRLGVESEEVFKRAQRDINEKLRMKLE